MGPVKILVLILSCSTFVNHAQGVLPFSHRNFANSFHNLYEAEEHLDSPTTGPGSSLKGHYGPIPEGQLPNRGQFSLESQNQWKSFGNSFRNTKISPLEKKLRIPSGEEAGGWYSSFFQDDLSKNFDFFRAPGNPPFHSNVFYKNDPMHDSRNISQDAPTPPPDPVRPPRYISISSRGTNGEFVTKAMELILEDGLFQDPAKHGLVFKSSHETEELFDFSLGDEGTSDDELLTILKNLFKISPRPAHKYRLNRRVSGLDPLAVAGDWIAVTISNVVATYLLGPIYTIMELKMTEYLSKQIGWEISGDGVPTSGAGSANSMAMAAAMFNFDPSTRDIGISHVGKIRVYISTHASISWKTAAVYNGVGTDVIREIRVDEWGRMDTNDLRRKIHQDMQNGAIPLMVVATAGTPVLGVIDPINEIAKLCQQKNIWLHVDAELAGGFLFTPATRRFQNWLHGINLANSVSISMWLFAAPYVTSMLLTRDPNILQHTFSLHANYLFMETDIYNMSYDRGDHTIQASRRPEISKIWFAALRGEENSHELFSYMDETKLSFIEYLSVYEGFVLVKCPSIPTDFQVPLVSFYYVPTKLKSEIHWPTTVRQITENTHRINKELLQRGLLDISVSYLPHESTSFPAFFTLSFVNTRLTPSDFEFILTSIATIGENNLSEIDALYFPQSYSEETSSLAFPNFPLKSKYRSFLKNVFEIAYHEGIFFTRKERSINLQPPESFDDNKIFDFTLPQTNEGDTFENIKTSFKSIIKYSPHHGHPYFMFQLIAGLDPYTIVADYISPVLNTPMISYNDGSAPFILMEKQIVREMLKRVYKTEFGDGIIADGGSMGNQLGLALARYNFNNGVGFKEQGVRIVSPQKLVMFMSQDAHYSNTKGAMFQGIGQNYTIQVEANNIGQMTPSKLRDAIQQTIRNGDIPIMVVITTGTTVYGAIDPINAIVDICEEFKIWCHVDGAFGGLVIFSDKHKSLYAGVERADSWSADLHKLMGSAMTCTIIITPHENIFRNVFSLSREEELQEELVDDEGDLNLLGRQNQLDKRNNVFKFWFLWKAKGRRGLEMHVNTILRNKQFLIAELRRREHNNAGFELVIDDFELTNVCFRYIPTALNPRINNNIDRNSADWSVAMDKFTLSLEKEFAKNGIVSFVTQFRQQTDGTDTPMFIKFVMMGSALTQDDIVFLLDAIAYYANKITPETRQLDSKNIEMAKTRFHPFGSLPKYYAPKCSTEPTLNQCQANEFVPDDK